MQTLTLSDFVILFLINLAVTFAVIYALNYAKRSAEVSVDEGSNDREYLKERIRQAVSEARGVLTELRVHEFKIPTGKRRLSRMNSLVEKLSLADEELATKFWGLISAPTLIAIADKTYERMGDDPKVLEYRTSITNAYYKDIEWTLLQCAELEKNPLKNIS